MTILALLLVGLVVAQVQQQQPQQQWNPFQSWQGQQPYQDKNGDWIQGNLKWNPQVSQWQPITTDQQFQQVQQPAPEVPVAMAAPRHAVLNAREARLQQIYGIPGKRNANQKLRTCCRNLGKEADVDCRRRFCASTPSEQMRLVIGFMATCAPKGPTVGLMWDCASSRADHTNCCRQQGVLDQCLAYCETTKGVPTDYLKYIVCLSQFDKIRTCFHDYLEHHPNIDGDK